MQSETKQCQNCKNDFVIESDDFAFYKKINVPPPTFCPECKLQRRMMFRNERILYKRKNYMNGEDIISIHRPDTVYTVYNDRTWWSDKWDPMDYAIDYDFSKPFFEQYRNLYQKIPLINLSITNMVNCSYCNVAEGDKNCFMFSASNQNEDSLYGNRVKGNKFCLDLYVASYNELCYELVNSSKNYKVLWGMHAYECSDSMFLYNCKNVQDSIGCVNLRNASYCILNKKYSREEYLKHKESLKLNTRTGFLNFQKTFFDFVKQNIHKYAHNQKTINSSGDNLENVSNLKNCFDIYEAQDSKNITWGGYGLKDAFDAGPGVGINSELIYDSFDTALQVSGCFWTGVVYHSFDVKYSINCHSSSNLFGCYGLRNKQYCILNKQYSKDEYFEMIEKIKKHMKDMPYIDKKARVFKYGDFFPYDLSPFAYNETIAQEYFPLSKEEVVNSGWSWYQREEREYLPTIKSIELVDDINEVQDGVLLEVIECENKGLEASGCTIAFKIMKEELNFYKRLQIPLPLYCPNCRHFNRLQKRNPLKLWHRACMCGSAGSPQATSDHGHEGKCSNEFETSYAPERPEIVYCESCYQKEVI
ncbi:hypothetical protein KC852_01575 [Candidatus Nomurabacteria bacterium]|nr:hypothetical protein [Candidatus Nomurabacteria bacterium]